MTPAELEERRRALEKQLEEDLELVRAAYRVKLRVLEMLSEPTPEENEPASPPPQSPVRPARVTAPGSVREDLAAVFDRLPRVFDRGDLCQALGYEPPRTTLGRALDELLASKKIARDRSSDGRHRTRYRKVGEG